MHEGDLDAINQPLDVLGVNYYSTVTAQIWDGVSPKQSNDGHKAAAGGTAWPGATTSRVPAAAGPVDRHGLEHRARGLEELLLSLREQFPQQPLMVTENGAAFDDVVADDGSVPDPERLDYLRRHFTAAHRALEQGVDLRGYFVWSLMDNFEWGYGYAKRFGIVRVDFDTLERTVKDSGRWYAELARTGVLPA